MVYGLGKRFSRCKSFIEAQYEVIGYSDKDDRKCKEEPHAKIELGEIENGK